MLPLTPEPPARVPAGPTGGLVFHHNPFQSPASSVFAEYSFAPSDLNEGSGPGDTTAVEWDAFLASSADLEEAKSSQAILSSTMVCNMLDGELHSLILVTAAETSNLAAARSCCIQLPGFSMFSPRLEVLKNDLETRELSSQVRLFHLTRGFDLTIIISRSSSPPSSL